MAAKLEWGTKRTCPKCSTRFYDLQNDDPVICISCGHEWVPEPILKSKQPIIPEAKKEGDKDAEDDEGLDGDDDTDLSLDDDDDDDAVLEDVTLEDDGGDDVGVVVDTKTDGDDDD